MEQLPSSLGRTNPQDGTSGTPPRSGKDAIKIQIDLELRNRLTEETIFSVFFLQNPAKAQDLLIENTHNQEYRRRVVSGSASILRVRANKLT